MKIHEAVKATADDATTSLDVVEYTISNHMQIKYVCPNCTKTCSVIYKPEKITWYEPNGDKEVERPK